MIRVTFSGNPILCILGYYFEGVLVVFGKTAGNVFVYSAGKLAEQHVERTIKQGISLSILEPYLSANLVTKLRASYPDNICFVWGDRGGDHGRKYWEQMQVGDLALCYQNRRIVSASFILDKYESLDAGLRAWPDATDEPYKLLFFLTRPIETNALVETLPRYFGQIYQGLRRLPKSELILQDYSSFDDFIRVALQGKVLEAEAAMNDEDNEYYPGNYDRRLIVEKQIRARRGQQRFREALRTRYQDRCVVSGCKILAILEAAHISPYRGEDDNHPHNGLLLRADIHTLFDLNLLGIAPMTLKVELHPDITVEYCHLAGQSLQLPEGFQPSPIAIGIRYEQFCQRKERPASYQ
ncbi:MAG TPA: HNH endonuclease signature motif containing protein [Gemmatales bacterium]|nr:HNH endonuclease signature motif containing protein [Gemmatales bacterium]